MYVKRICMALVMMIVVGTLLMHDSCCFSVDD